MMALVVFYKEKSFENRSNEGSKMWLKQRRKKDVIHFLGRSKLRNHYTVAIVDAVCSPPPPPYREINYDGKSAQRLEHTIRWRFYLVRHKNHGLGLIGGGRHGKEVNYRDYITSVQRPNETVRQSTRWLVQRVKIQFWSLA